MRPKTLKTDIINAILSEAAPRSMDPQDVADKAGCAKTYIYQNPKWREKIKPERPTFIELNRGGDN